jgi:3-(3-hydroxy-phenyl)propionate hydroxylase
MNAMIRAPNEPHIQKRGIPADAGDIGEDMRDYPLNSDLPVAIVGAGPVGLTTALGLAYHGIPFQLFEAGDKLSTETKAGTTLTRTLEVFHRFGVADKVLTKALRVDEIGDVDRASNTARYPVKLEKLRRETRFPFIINLPQHDMEPVLAEALAKTGKGKLFLEHRLVAFSQTDQAVDMEFETPNGKKRLQAGYLLGCDGGRSTVRDNLGVEVTGASFPERYCLVDLKVDLDVANPRDYPYISYFSDTEEWMLLVRQPQCWRFLYPLPEGAEDYSQEDLRDKAMHYIGDVSDVEVLGSNIYSIHHKVAEKWRQRRIFLMGDAAHLITPMWALGLNTGILDVNALTWRLAWFLRGWAKDGLLDGYEREQKPVAERGSGEMAESARRYMSGMSEKVSAMSEHDWGNAYTRTMLGVRYDIDGKGNWSMVKSCPAPPPVEVGDRAPDRLMHDGAGKELRLHDLFGASFVALYFTDTRRRPPIPENTSPALKHFAVSRWDAPIDSGLRERTLFDSGDGAFKRYGCAPETMVLVRPDDHIAAICPIEPGRAAALYEDITGMPPPQEICP